MYCFLCHIRLALPLYRVISNNTFSLIILIRSISVNVSCHFPLLSKSQKPGAGQLLHCPALRVVYPLLHLLKEGPLSLDGNILLFLNLRLFLFRLWDRQLQYPARKSKNPSNKSSNKLSPKIQGVIINHRSFSNEKQLVNSNRGCFV